MAGQRPRWEGEGEVNPIKRKVASKGIEIINGKVISGRHFGDSVSPGHAG